MNETHIDKKVKIYNANQIEALKELDKSKKQYDGFVYAVDIGSQVKIGQTQHIFDRISSLTRFWSMYADKTAISIAVTDAHMNFVENEKYMHDAFKAFRAKGEMFNIDFASAVEKMSELQLNKSDSERKQRSESEQKVLENFKAILLGNPQAAYESDKIDSPSYFYTKTIVNGKCVKIPIDNDSVFTVCPDCKKEIKADIDDLIEIEDFDFYHSVVYCIECTERRIAKRIGIN